MPLYLSTVSYWSSCQALIFLQGAEKFYFYHNWKRRVYLQVSLSYLKYVVPWLFKKITNNLHRIVPAIEWGSWKLQTTNLQEHSSNRWYGVPFQSQVPNFWYAVNFEGKIKFSKWMMRLLLLKNLTLGAEWVLVVPSHPEGGIALVCRCPTEPLAVHQTYLLPLSSQVFHRTEP